jgi:hypothetical protein
MARGETPQQKAKRLAQRAINQVRNPQEKKKLAESLGYTLGTGRASGFLQSRLPQNNQTAQRVVKAIESATTKHSNPRMAAGGATQVNIAKFQENLGETPAEEYARIQAAAREYEQRPFREAEAAERQADEARQAYERQLAEQQRIKAEVSAQLAEAESKAKIAGRRSAAVSTQLRSRAMLEQAQVQQAQGRAVQALQRSQKPTGTTVGQPGRSRTRVASGLGIGGYGGTRAARVSPTGLNI